MLQKWQKPWLFYRMTLAGVVLMALMYGLQYLLTLLFGGEVGYGSIIAFIVPMICPLMLMVFFWEMNIPRNISVIELLGIFLCGAAFCFFVTFVLFLVVSDPVEGWDGERGFLDEARIRRLVPDFAERTSYICGPQVMNDFCKSALEAMGVP